MGAQFLLLLSCVCDCRELSASSLHCGILIPTASKTLRPGREFAMLAGHTGPPLAS